MSKIHLDKEEYKVDLRILEEKKNVFPDFQNLSIPYQVLGIFGGVQNFLCKESCHLQTVTVLLLPLKFDFFLFIFSYCYGQEFQSVLNKTDETGHPCLVPYLRENAFSFSLLSMLICGLVIHVLYYVEVHSFHTDFVESFKYKWIFIFFYFFLVQSWESVHFQEFSPFFQVFPYYWPIIVCNNL